ncbi:DNA polymerase III subunit gamma/tau [Candidatus Saccharibacteria bacterium]|nr:DNA polymerase III subunit gamma/tau [Candidatus Saccharibacteria bacterium]
MSQALYRKYRSTTLDEIVGQDLIVSALKNALSQQKLSHAYLFTGPRGVGKTSIARILAHEVNNFEYSGENLPLDIIEIDAASNRRIDEIRDLREKVHIAPLQAKYKVYIIDEVHMLTTDSFNALLKTLEEPPAHVIFILATTDAHKIPETILSRTQRYNFRLASSDIVKSHLAKIAKKEQINISSDALNVLAKHSGGSLRDALSLLDQVRHSSSQEITKEEVEDVLGIAPSEIVDRLIESIEAKDIKQLMTLLETAYEKGVYPGQLASSLVENIRQSLATSQHNLPASVSLKLLKELLATESSNRPQVSLELALIEAIVAVSDNLPAKTYSAKISQPSISLSKPAVKPNKNQSKVATNSAKSNESASENTNKSQVVGVNEPAQDYQAKATKLDAGIWNEVLEDLRHSHNTLYSVLRLADIDYSDIQNSRILLQFKFPFHKKRMSDNKNQQIVLDKLSTHGVSGYELVCDTKKSELETENIMVGAISTASDTFSAPTTEITLNRVKNIFGGAEVLE